MSNNERVGGIEFEAEVDWSKIDGSSQKLEAALSKVEKGTGKFNKTLADSEKTAKKAGGAFDGLFKQFTAASIIGGIVTGAFGRVTAALSQFIKGTVTASSNLTELNSKAEVVFGKSLPAVAHQVKLIAAEVGRASSSVLQFATDIGAIISSFGIAGPLLDQMSTQFAKLAIDMASFSNATDEEAFNALRSGITGETEPLKRFGIVLTDANLQMFAFEKGIKMKVTAMNQAQKTALRYAFIMDKTALAQGDAARTADSYANQSRRLAGEIKTLQEQLGKGATPALADGLGFLSSVLQSARIFTNLLVTDLTKLLGMLGISGTGGTSAFGKNLKRGIAEVAYGVPLVGPVLRGASSVIGTAYGPRIQAVKNAEANAPQAPIEDPLKDFYNLGGGSGNDTGGGGAEEREKLANDILKAEEAIVKALGEQAEENKDNVDIIRSELKLKEKLGTLTDRERTQLERLNRRLEYKTDVIEDATKAWEDQVQAIETAEERVQDLIETIAEERKDLQDTLKDIDKDAAESALEQAAKLVKERDELKLKGSGSTPLSNSDRWRLNEIDDELRGFGDDVVSQASDLAKLSPAELIERDRQMRREEATEKANARIAELQAELDAENAKLATLRAAEMEKKNILQTALTERRTITDANYAAIEERTTAHVNHEIAEFNRLSARLRQSGGSAASLPAFANGGMVRGPGGGTDDSIVARLSNGERVITAATNRMYAPILEAIHRRTFPVPRFAEGGVVNNNKTATITVKNYGRAAEAYADPRRARWDARTYF